MVVGKGIEKKIFKYIGIRCGLQFPQWFMYGISTTIYSDIQKQILIFGFDFTDVCVAKNATVGELKQAVEDVFVSCRKEISW